MITAQLLVKNDIRTINKTLQSLQHPRIHLIVGDRGSTDGSIGICKSHQAEIFNVSHLPRHEARNLLIRKSNSLWHIYLDPWEALIKGNINAISNMAEGCYFASIIQTGFLKKEVRLWSTGYYFVDPVFERIKTKSDKECIFLIYSEPRNDYEDLLVDLAAWKAQEPLKIQPHYYEALILLTLGKREEFLRASAGFMHMTENRQIMSVIMNRYYYACTLLTLRRDPRAILQNITLCLVAQPLMAEFWCLMGDVYYHLLSDFSKAKAFYENAIFLGRKRSKTDKWPMELAKYKEYPERMIQSCSKILELQELLKPLR